MKVQDVMSKEPRAVRMVDRLDEAARILWEQDCGFVPVVDGANVLVGVVTDRDLCMASYTQGKPFSEVPVLAVMARELTTAKPEDDIASAMQAMAMAQVHRLPIVDARGVLLGVLASNDLARVAVARPAALAAAKVVATMAAIGKPRQGGRDFAAAAKPVAKKRASRVKTATQAAGGAKTVGGAKTAAKPGARSAKTRATKRKA